MINNINENTIVLQWKEDITIKNIELFRQEMDRFLKLDKNKLVLNLSSVSYINSAGLGVIAESVIQGRKHQKELVISNIQTIRYGDIFNCKISILYKII